jgi:hypothetical protein
MGKNIIKSQRIRRFSKHYKNECVIVNDNQKKCHNLKCSEACRFKLADQKKITKDTFVHKVRGRPRFSQCTICSPNKPCYYAWLCRTIQPDRCEKCTCAYFCVASDFIVMHAGMVLLFLCFLLAIFHYYYFLFFPSPDTDWYW